MIKKKYLLVLGIVILGLWLRLYHFREWYIYGHDQDLIAWIVKDVVVNKHWRLIGQLTSTPGIFIGPGFYYWSLPFLLLTKMDPIGMVFGAAVLSGLGIISFYFIFNWLFNHSTGMVAALVYASSYFLVTYDRDPVPTMPVVIWTAWWFYALNLLLTGKRSGYILSGLLAALIWHLNMALVLVLPLALVSIILSRRRLEVKGIFWGLLVFLLVSLPLLLFEARHGFTQTRALVAALTTNQGGVISGWYLLEKVLVSVGNTLQRLLVGNVIPLHYQAPLLLAAMTFIFLRVKKVLSSNLSLILLSWLGVYCFFFSLYSKVLSEYYLNGVIIVWIVLLSLLVGWGLQLKRGKWWFLLLGIITVLNIKSLLSQTVEPKGYLQKKALVGGIDSDRTAHQYPCVSVSYITNPGYELGYRYFFYLQNLKVLKPDSGAPVYTIVYPHTLVNKGEIDEYYSSLGLIKPDYSKYNKTMIDESCSGENANLTDPMFGFTD